MSGLSETGYLTIWYVDYRAILIKDLQISLVDWRAETLNLTLSITTCKWLHRLDCVPLAYLFARVHFIFQTFL